MGAVDMTRDDERILATKPTGSMRNPSLLADATYFALLELFVVEPRGKRELLANVGPEVQRAVLATSDC